ncbi:MAG: glycosyltransferase [Taibaiella sp.]|nr:glycosyltransferase [Taibaiella sp.]
MILIDALFINKGGGAVLLQYLIEKILLLPEKDNFFFLLDPRFEVPAVLTKNYLVIPNKVSDRVKFYKENKTSYTKVFCFANTPPPLRLNVPVYTYSHNQKLLEAPRQKFKKSYWRLYIKYLFIKFYNKNTDYYIVQTPHMVHELLGTGLKDAAHCLTIPFYDAEKYKGATLPFAQRPEAEFAFVSTPSPQKNYPTLLDAWEYLHSKGHRPGLHITIDSTAPHLLARLEDMKARGIRVFNYSYIDPRELYFKYRYLVCPSVMESFGLPLIESVESGMKVLAPDLAYVYDVIKPSATFNPWDKVSIADAVVAAMTHELPFPEIIAKNDIDKLLALLV